MSDPRKGNGNLHLHYSSDEEEVYNLENDEFDYGCFDEELELGTLGFGGSV